MEIMKKLESRPEQVKVKKYLDYERLNLKSHLYNETLKTEKMFRQLNAPKGQPPKKTEDDKLAGEQNSQQLSIAL